MRPNRVTPIVMVLVLLGGPVANAALPSSQHDALVDLYNSTNGAGWTNRTNWLVAADECTWYGITCNTGHTTVQGISFGGNGNKLSGTLPPSLGNLSNLQDLYLGTNQLTGPIPTQIGSLMSLQSLVLGGCSPLPCNFLPGTTNQLSGNIPTQLGNLTSLRHLDLSGNQLTGSIPTQIGSATSLQDLYLGFNHLSGGIPTQIGNLTSLHYLGLSSNQLSGGIPTQIGNLSSLRYLDLSRNQVTGSIPTQIGSATSLQFLYLADNHLSGSIPTQIGSLTSLQALDLSRNQVTGSIPTQVGNLNSLQYLFLSDNRLTGIIPQQIGSLTSLQLLYLYGNQLGGSIPSTLTNLTGLVWLDIRWNALYSTGSALTSFLNGKQNGGDWQSTQTVSPTDLRTSDATANAIIVNWTPISYTADSGFYQTRYSTTAGGPYTTFAATTSSKASSSLVVAGLSANTRYYFIVTTSTQPHSFNSNTVVSGFSEEVSGQTSGSGPAAPVATFSWSPPSPKAGQQVQFTDTSTGTPASWSWTFGDGTSSSSQSPSHVFTVNGTYSVKLTAANSSGSNSITRELTVAAASTAPIAKFEWLPVSPKASEEVQFSDTSTGTPTSWSWVFGDGGTSTSRNPKHTFVAVGTYAVKLTATSAGGSDSLTRNVTVAVASGPCPHAGWSDLKFATSAIGKELEAFHGDIPDPHPTLYEMITRSLDNRVRDLKVQIQAAAPNTAFTRLSGYRPPDYQDHLYQLKTLYEAMYKVRGSITAIQCASEIAKVEDEKIFHKLGPQKPDGVEIPGTLAVSKRSNHEFGNALDVSVVPTPVDWAAVVRRNNLLEPCTERAVHLQTKENPVCGASTTVTAVAFVPSGVAGIIAASSVPLVPIRLLLRDPGGRRVGYDALTGAAINEIGATATYSGVDSDPQVVTIEDAVGGDYRVEAVAVSSGAYTLMLSADDQEHGANFGSRSTTGNAVVGYPIEPLSLGVQQTTPELPGRRRVVRH